MPPYCFSPYGWFPGNAMCKVNENISKCGIIVPFFSYCQVFAFVPSIAPKIYVSFLCRNCVCLPPRLNKVYVNTGLSKKIIIFAKCNANRTFCTAQFALQKIK